MSECILTQDVGVLECPICLKFSKARAGWLGVFQSGCGHEWHEEMWMGSIVMDRRKHLKLTRRQMGELTGYSPHSIKSYEWKKCTKAYFDNTEKIMKKMR